MPRRRSDPDAARRTSLCPSLGICPFAPSAPAPRSTPRRALLGPAPASAAPAPPLPEGFRSHFLSQGSSRPRRSPRPSGSSRPRPARPYPAAGPPASGPGASPESEQGCRAGMHWDGPEGENALSAVSILLLAGPSPPAGRQELEGLHLRASLPPILCLPHPLIPHSLGEGARPLGVVREVTEEENQYLVCLEKQQYFNSVMPEETAGPLPPPSVCKSDAKLQQSAE